MLSSAFIVDDKRHLNEKRRGVEEQCHSADNVIHLPATELLLRKNSHAKDSLACCCGGEKKGRKTIVVSLSSGLWKKKESYDTHMCSVVICERHFSSFCLSVEERRSNKASSVI